MTKRMMMAAAGTALAAWAAASAQDAGADDVEALAARYGKLTATARPDISPDGRYLARQVAHGGRYVLRIEGVDGSDPVLWGPADGASLGGFDWTGDGTLLVRTTVLAGVRKRTLDPDGKRSKQYVEVFEEQRPQVITPQAKTVAKMTFRRLGAIDVFAPLAAPEVSRGDMPVFIGTEGAGRYGEKFGPARVSLTKNKYDFDAPPVKGSGYYAYRGNHDGSVVLADRTELGETERTYYLRTDGRWRRLDGLDLSGFDLMGVEDEDTLLVRDEAEGGLHLYDLGANAVRETLHPGPAYPIRRPSDGAVIAVSLREGGVAFLDQAEEAAHARAEAVIGEGLYPLDASHDGRFRLYSRAAGGRPVAYHVWDAEAGRLVRTLSSWPDMASAEGPSVTAMTYAARDGLRIEGFLSKPAGRAPDAPPLPLVVMPHGGPASRDTAGFDAWREYLTSLGYAVFQPNFRGSTGYGEDFARAGYEEWGAAMQTDIVDGVAALVEAGDADPDRLAIMGGSYGGYAALMGTLDETPYRCAVSIAGPVDLLGMLDTEQTGSGFDYWARHMGKGRLSEAEFAARSPLRRAGEIDVPVLLIHGGLDHVVRKGQSAALELAMKAAGGDVRAVYLMESGHGFEIEEDRQRMLAEAGAFLGECLPTD